MNASFQFLSRRDNQARGIGQYAIDFLAERWGKPDETVLARVEQFHLDSVGCGIAALAIRANAPTVLRKEALGYADANGAVCFGSRNRVAPEKVVVANCSAVRELDANGTNFGYNPRTGYCRGEFGHNDFYPVAVAAASVAGLDGRQTLLGMLCLDEIRGRLAEVYGLKDHKIDHVLHGAIASAAVYGAMLGASPEQIESAIGMVVAHYVPFRAIRHGEQLSDSKGASAAISAEVAVLSMRRALRGFVGPADIFRNPQAVFCLFERPPKNGESPFELELAAGGSDFAVMRMHFKLGLYEHQSAGAIAGLFQLLQQYPRLLDDVNQIEKIEITIYEPAFGIIGDPHKRDPRTRQSADHSMLYIVGTLMRKAAERKESGDLWAELMLTPDDYSEAAILHPMTRDIMRRIEFRHGGPEYDAKYPEGIPTTVEVVHQSLGRLSSGLVMYPEGHSRNASGNLARLLKRKFHRLAQVGVHDVDALTRRLTGLAEKSSREIQELYSFEIEHVRPA